MEKTERERESMRMNETKKEKEQVKKFSTNQEYRMYMMKQNYSIESAMNGQNLRF